MAGRVASLDWAQTPLGPRDGWSPALRHAADLVLHSAFPMMLLWGQALTQLYNDAYIPLIGTRHPRALGQPVGEVWPEQLAAHEALFGRVWRGESAYFQNAPGRTRRHDFEEDAAFTLAYSPVHGEGGAVAGILVAAIETTAEVLHARRQAALLALGARLSSGGDAPDLGAALAGVQAGADLPFVALYRLADGGDLLLADAAGVDAGGPLPARVAAADQAAGPWAFAPVLAGRRTWRVVVPPGLALWPGLDAPTLALAVPVPGAAGAPLAGALLCGLNPHLPLNPAYAAHAEAVAVHLGAALVRQARQAEHERGLRAVNRELDALAYTVSHDLRAPVRRILGFAGLLGKALDAGEVPKAQHYADVIAGAGTRMGALLDDLLTYSRDSRAPLRLSRVPLDDLAAAVVARLAPDLRGPVAWHLAPLPQVRGDRALLAVALLHLLSNAVKFSARQAAPRVEVWAEEEAGVWRILVRDNGVGFDPRYGDRLFGVFQRLHREGEFEGNGIGLATVRRIVTRHGGEVFARGEAGAGATVGFTLPRG